MKKETQKISYCMEKCLLKDFFSSGDRHTNRCHST